MRILGVDPGSVQTGFGVICEKDASLIYLGCGVIRTSSASPIALRLKRIYSELKNVMERYQPDVVSIESIFVARNAQSALKLGHARGVAILAAVNCGLVLVEYTPAEVKKTLAGSGRAEKSQVQHMVKALLSLKELPEPYDASDALALAICHSHSREMKEKMQALAR